MNRDRDAQAETSSTSRGSSTTPRMTLLAEGFTPGRDDVICGRGKKCYSHIGNERFRQRVTAVLNVYSQAKSKLDKSNVLSSVVEQVRAASKDGGFVKQDGEDGRWYEVGDFLAREKTSQAFRDALHEQYKSSTVAKKKRRQREQARASDKLKPPPSKSAMSKRLEGLSAKVNRSDSDEHLNDLFNRSNTEIMDRINLLQRRNLREDSSTSPSFAASHSHSDPRLSSMNASTHTNVSPFTFGHGQLPPSRGVNPYASFPRSRSAPTTPPHHPFENPPSEMDELHHSVPNIAYTHELLPIDEALGQQSLNQSVPNLNYSHQQPPHPGQAIALDMEPIPFDYYSPQHRKGSIKKHVMIANAAASAAAVADIPIPVKSSSSPPSDDLLDCLAKLTETSLGGDDLFEPNPLAVTSAHSAMSVEGGDFSPLDGSDIASVFDEDQVGAERSQKGDLKKLPLPFDS